MLATININDIKPYWRNPRKNDNAIAAVKKSIAEFGFNSPIIVDGNNIIIAGHTRYRALQELVHTEINCIVKADLTPQQVKAYRIADNKVGEIAVWDMEKLMQELREIPDIDEMQDYFLDINLKDFLQDSGGLNFKPITQANIDKIEGELSAKFDGMSVERQSTYVEVICPHCAETFNVDRNEIYKSR